ncbi:MAG: macro domain-containing protein [Patescibacteria group bacterium]|nr:macro domain-containing protein [Patescibacteria group bacterium]
MCRKYKAKITPKMYFGKGDILEFDGDALICPCFTDLTYCKESKLVSSIIELAGKDLEKELSSIGFCDFGSAVITKGYGLKVKNIIFLPYKDKENPDNIIDFILLHKAFRSAFNLASLYNLKTLATVPLFVGYRKRDFINRIMVIFGLEKKEEKTLHPHEVVDIIIGVLDEYKGKIEDLVIYR